MVLGLFILILGLMIALFPALLSYLAAFFLITIGATILMVSFSLKKAHKSTKNPFINFIIRF